MSLSEKISSRINQIQLGVRERVTGKIVLRRRLPVPHDDHQTQAEKIFYKRVLNLALENQTTADVVWDIGCRNWSYAAALADVFTDARLIGVEVDGRRRYFNLYRRMDYAASQASVLSLEGRDSQCLFTDFRNVPVEAALTAGEKTVFCFFFPFVSANPCLKWGLPLNYAGFHELLKHALHGALVAKAQPTILSCHQGEWEAEIALEAYKQAGLNPKQQILKAADYAGLWPSSHDIHVLTSGASGAETISS